MASTSGFGTIQSLGVGSGLDVKSLVDQLVSAERDPKTKKFDAQEAGYQAKISAYGNLKSALTSFQNTVSGMDLFSDFNRKTATSSDEAVLTGSAVSTASSGTYDINVSQLAQAQSLASQAYSDVSSPVGTGTLTIRFGTTDYNSGTDTYNSFSPNADSSTLTVQIDAQHNSLEGVRDAINGAGGAVHASLVNDGSGYRLVLSSNKTGAENSLQVSVADDDGNNSDTSGLSALAFDPSATNLDQTVAAQDAQITLNGLPVSSASNTVVGAVPGASINLKSTGGPVTLSVDADKSNAKSLVQGFVKSYNDLVTTLSSLTSYNSDTKQGGMLLGDPVARQLETRLRQVISSTVPGMSGSVRSFVDIGLTTQKDGTLSLDSKKLSDALDTNFKAVGQLFAAAGTTENSQVTYLGSFSSTKPGSYGVNVTQPATRGEYDGAGVLPATIDGANPFTVDSSNDTFQVLLDGFASGQIQLTHADYTSGQELAAEIQSRINGDSKLQNRGVSALVEYDQSNNRLVVRSATYGSASKVQFSSVESGVSSTLGISSGSGTAGQDVAGTIGGQPATGIGQVLTSSSGDARGLQLQITADSAGSYGSVSFSRGTGSSLSSLFNSYLGGNGLLADKVNGLKDRIAGINDNRKQLSNRLDQMQARLISEFSNMDQIVSQMQSTGSYLTAQLANLPYSSSNSGKN